MEEHAPFTVERLLGLPLFRHAEVIGGREGLTNEIYYVDSMEMPDLTGWLRPNELILTTGYSFRFQPDMLCRLLDEMHRVGGSAIGIKTKRFLQEVPPEAIQKSNRYGIPLFDIPLDITYMDMTHAIMEQILNHQTYMLREAHEIHQQFTNLVLNRKASELVAVLGNLLQCEVAVLQADGDIESCTAAFGSVPVAQMRRICVGSRILGNLVITRVFGEADRFENMCLDHAVTVLALEFTIRQSQQLHRAREQEVLLIELLSGCGQQEELLQYRAKQLGLPTGSCYYVMAITAREEEIQPEISDRIAALYNKIIEEWTLPGLNVRKAVEINGTLLALCPFGRDDAAAQRKATEQDIQSLLHRIEEQAEGIHFTAGVGALRHRLVDLHESRKEALQALKLGEGLLPRRTVIHFDDIAVEHLFSEVSGHPVLQRFQRELVEPLAQYDQNYGTDLLATLELYMRTGSTKRVAQELYIHRNSVLYRLERIAEVLQADLNDPETRFRLELAVRHWKAGRKEQR